MGPARAVVGIRDFGLIHPPEVAVLVLVWYKKPASGALMNDEEESEAITRMTCQGPDKPIQMSGMSTWWKSGRFPLMKNCSSLLHRSGEHFECRINVKTDVTH